MKIASVQNNPVFGDKKGNIEKLFSLIDSKNAELYILPELCYTGYQFISKEEVENLSDKTDSPFIHSFIEKAQEKNAGIIFGFIENDNGSFYNASMFVTPDGVIHIYRKTHLFYKEKLFFTPGNKGFDITEFRGIKIGMAICFDWIFPESFRTLALKGADLIAHSANLVMPYCQQTDFARAIENKVYIVTSNRIGTESRDGESLTFTGESVVLSPKGEYLVRAGKNTEEINIFNLETELARNKALNPFNNVFEDRQKKYYNI